MSAKQYTVLEMEAMTEESEEALRISFTHRGNGSVEVTMGGRFRTVSLSPDDVRILTKFLQGNEYNEK